MLNQKAASSNREEDTYVWVLTADMRVKDYTYSIGVILSLWVANRAVLTHSRTPRLLGTLEGNSI